MHMMVLTLTSQPVRLTHGKMHACTNTRSLLNLETSYFLAERYRKGHKFLQERIVTVRYFCEHHLAGMYICVCVRACEPIRMFACLCVRVYVQMQVREYAFVNIPLYLYASMRMRMYVYIQSSSSLRVCLAVYKWAFEPAWLLAVHFHRHLPWNPTTSLQPKQVERSQKHCSKKHDVQRVGFIRKHVIMAFRHRLQILSSDLSYSKAYIVASSRFSVFTTHEQVLFSSV